jgi:maleate cis-trans isomerase
MKTSLIISLLCLSSMSSFAQTHVQIPANAKPVYPTTPYVQLQDPPCYTYINKRGLEIMECPGARFLPEHSTVQQQTPVVTEDALGNIKVESRNTYLGYRKLYPEMPANAVPAYPTSPYVQLQDPPCYKYINKRGIEIMECPGARFLPEAKDK